MCAASAVRRACAAARRTARRTVRSSWSGRCSSRNTPWSSRNEPSGLRSIRLSQDRARVLRLAVGRQAHHLVFAGIDLEAGVIGEGRIEQAERMREVDLLQRSRACCPGPARATSSPIRRRRPCVRTAASSKGEGKNADAAWLRWCSANSRRFCQSKSAPPNCVQLLAQQRLLEQLLLQPQRHRHAEGAEAARREGEIGFEQPLELQERLVVEDDVVDVAELDAGRCRGNRRSRSPGKPESCFLRVKRSSCAARDDVAVLDQRGGAVVIDRPKCRERA